MRLYFGYITVAIGGDLHTHAVCHIAPSEEAAKEGAIAHGIKTHPGGFVCVVKMFEMDNDYLAQAAILSGVL